MKAIKITIAGAGFLLPDSHEDYEFPTYILKHKAAIAEHVEAGKDFMSADYSDLPDLSQFKRVTGIIGYPFNAHDPDLYAFDRNIDVVLEVDLDDIRGKAVGEVTDND